MLNRFLQMSLACLAAATFAATAAQAKGPKLENDRHHDPVGRCGNPVVRAQQALGGPGIVPEQTQVATAPSRRWPPLRRDPRSATARISSAAPPRRLVAWEVSRQLVAGDEEVGLLVMFDTHGPAFRSSCDGNGTSEGGGAIFARVEFPRRGTSSPRRAGRWEYMSTKPGRHRRQSSTRTERRRLRAMIERRTLPRAIRKVRESGAEASRAVRAGPYAGRVALLR